VDRSFHNARTFLDTNVTGSHHVFQACRDMEVPRVIHVSTDEVYGPRQDHEEADENAVLMPTNPYSASKAAAEMLARAAWKAYGTPIVLVRPNNIYGARQFPEKLIPRFVLLAASDKVLTIHGSGLQRRRFLAVEDVVSGIITVLEKGAPGETYNIGTNDTYSVLEVADLICATFGKKVETLVRHVENRPFNDDCYATDTRRLRAMGWAPRRTLRADLASLSQEIRHLNTVREQTPEVAIEAAEAWSS
jgi:UDP-glucose 4,6-dehydratase